MVTTVAMVSRKNLTIGVIATLLLVGIGLVAASVSLSGSAPVNVTASAANPQFTSVSIGGTPCSFSTTSFSCGTSDLGVQGTESLSMTVSNSGGTAWIPTVNVFSTNSTVAGVSPGSNPTQINANGVGTFSFTVTGSAVGSTTIEANLNG